MLIGYPFEGTIPIHEALPGGPTERGSGNNGSIRFRDLNLILLEPEKYSAWTKATDFCLDNPAAIARDYRVQVFELHEKQEIHDQLDAIMANRFKPPTSTAMPLPWMKTSRAQANLARLSKP